MVLSNIKKKNTNWIRRKNWKLVLVSDPLQSCFIPQRQKERERETALNGTRYNNCIDIIAARMCVVFGVTVSPLQAASTIYFALDANAVLFCTSLLHRTPFFFFNLKCDVRSSERLWMGWWWLFASHIQFHWKSENPFGRRIETFYWIHKLCGVEWCATKAHMAYTPRVLQCILYM